MLEASPVQSRNPVAHINHFPNHSKLRFKGELFREVVYVLFVYVYKYNTYIYIHMYLREREGKGGGGRGEKLFIWQRGLHWFEVVK